MIILGSYVVTYFSTTVCLVKLSIPSIYHNKAKLYFLWQITRHQTEIQYPYHSFSARQFSQNSFIAFNPVSGNYIGKHPYLKECDSTADNHICGPLDFEYGQDGKCSFQTGTGVNYHHTKSQTTNSSNSWIMLAPLTLSTCGNSKISAWLVLSPLTLSGKIGDPDQIRTGDLSLDRAVC